MMMTAPAAASRSVVVESSKSDKKKRKHQESSPASQEGSDESVVEELLKQYETYKTQFEEWTTKNKGNVSQEAYDKYVDDFRSWEKVVLGQIKTATKKHSKLNKKKDHKKRSKSDKTPRDQVEVQETAAAATVHQKPMDPNMAANMDPLAMMMTMAMMMMPAMMQQQQQQTPQQIPQPLPQQAMMPPQQPPQQQPIFPSSTAAPVPPFNNSSPAKQQTGGVVLPDLSRPPPGGGAMGQSPQGPPRMMAPPPAGMQPMAPYEETRRSSTIDYGHRAPVEYDDYWYRKNQERMRNEMVASSMPPLPMNPGSMGPPRPPPMPGPPPPFLPPQPPMAAGPPHFGAGRPHPPQQHHHIRPQLTGPPQPLFPNFPTGGGRDDDRNHRMSPPLHQNHRNINKHKMGARDFSMRRRN